jgi:hypothetical protein
MISILCDGQDLNHSAIEAKSELMMGCVFYSADIAIYCTLYCIGKFTRLLHLRVSYLNRSSVNCKIQKLQATIRQLGVILQNVLPKTVLPHVKRPSAPPLLVG